MNEKKKTGKVIKSKRRGREWTREEQRRKGGTPAPRGVIKGFMVWARAELHEARGKHSSLTVQ